jgi:putative ABC transport system substrate-binding protein
MDAAARNLDQRIVVLNAGTASEIDQAFATMIERQVGALLVNGDRFLSNATDQLVALAARSRIPASYSNRSQVERGGLMSYGDDRFQSWRHLANYVGRIFKGEKPSDLPVVQPTKFEFVINLQTARTLGLTIPETLLATADEVIQ